MGIGTTAKEPAASYQRALTLCRALPGRGRERFLATWGIWFHATVSGRTAEAAALADDLVTIARELGDTGLLVEAYHAQVPDPNAAAGSRGHEGSCEGSHPPL